MATATKAPPGTSPADPPPMKGVTHRYADANGIRIHYAEAGDGPPLLLLHGWPQHHYMWHDVIEELRGTYRVIAPDLRGFGWSEAPGDGYSPETFVQDQIALLDALEIEKVRVIGHDWGGWTTFLLALDHPERCERIMPLNIPHPWPRLSPWTIADQLPRGWYAAVMATPPVGRLLQTQTDFIKRGLRGASAPDTFGDNELEIYAAPYRDPARAEAASSLYRYYVGLNASVLRGSPIRRARLTVPTLLLFGENDAAISTRLVRDGWQEHADDMAVEFTQNGHFIVNESPSLVAERARAFFG